MTIAANISRVEEQIAVACRNAGRPRQDVRLMAVSKTHPADMILEAYAAGLRLFGENRVQEYAGKRTALETAGLFDRQSGASFHLIGPLQSNKADRATNLFDGIDTVDSLRLAERLNLSAQEAAKKLSILVEIKLSSEASKHGVVPATPEADELFERLADFANLQVRGLMTVPPPADDPEQARPYFQQLRELRDSLTQHNPRLMLDELSMGMSHDFPVAIAEGATLVRIGTAIFGSRPPLQ